jgi:hypothetical protein
MPFLVIKGTFHIEGYSPDGVSVRFRADNKEHWANGYQTAHRGLKSTLKHKTGRFNR